MRFRLQPTLSLPPRLFLSFAWSVAISLLMFKMLVVCFPIWKLSKKAGTCCVVYLLFSVYYRKLQSRQIVFVLSGSVKKTLHDVAGRAERVDVGQKNRNPAKS